MIRPGSDSAPSDGTLPLAGGAIPGQASACPEYPPPAPPPPTGADLTGADPVRDALFAEMQPLVTRLLHQYGESAEHKEDLRGEIFCRFCELLRAYDPARGIPLRPYLVRMLTLAVYTSTRSGWRRQEREVRLESRLVTRQARQEGDPSETWIEQIQTDAMLSQLPAAIAELPRNQRQVVVWRYYELRSFDEMAELLRVRPSTARSLLRHALRTLRQRLLEPERTGL